MDNVKKLLVLPIVSRDRYSFFQKVNFLFQVYWKSGLPTNFKRKTGTFMAYVYDLVKPNKNPDLQIANMHDVRKINHRDPEKDDGWVDFDVTGAVGRWIRYDINGSIEFSEKESNYCVPSGWVSILAGLQLLMLAVGYSMG